MQMNHPVEVLQTERRGQKSDHVVDVIYGRSVPEHDRGRRAHRPEERRVDRVRQRCVVCVSHLAAAAVYVVG